MKFNQLQTCPTCGKEVQALFSSGASPVPSCNDCYSKAQTRAIEACNPRETNELQKRGVTVKTIQSAVRESLK